MKRSEAREQAFVLIFERSIRHDTTEQIIDCAEQAHDVRVDEFAHRLALGAEQHEEELDEIIRGNTRGWRMDRLSKVALSLLRLALYEMLYEKQIPTSVSINEAVDLAKKYGGADDAPFINGVLGSVARKQEKEPSDEPEEKQRGEDPA